ncbi:MAG: 50S ribosomal protein L9 [Porticoccaceae bacterium]
MEVILLEKVGRLGAVGDRVSVKSGYGRNYLIPQRKAIFATPDNIAKFEQQKADLLKEAADKLAVAQARATALAAIGEIVIKAVAGEEGRLFGSVGTKDIADAVTAAGVELARTEVKMPAGALRELGSFEIDVQVHADVIQTLQVRLIAE